ncbi:MAG TPA: hypothetical protein DCE41_09450 [Cytophagales bacterium]|nr:hypothetical protein [Cytophagales bacterium]
MSREQDFKVLFLCIPVLDPRLLYGLSFPANIPFRRIWKRKTQPIAIKNTEKEKLYVNADEEQKWQVTSLVEWLLS